MNHHLYGMRVYESDLAMSYPDKTPHTLDMQNMVDDLRERGEVRQTPAIFMGQGQCIVHPTIMATIKHINRDAATTGAGAAVVGCPGGPHVIDPIGLWR